MRNALSAINSWLKANKLEVPDEIIRSIHLTHEGENSIVLGFASEDILGQFAMRVLPNATVAKVETPDYTVYSAKIDWKKRPIVFTLTIVPNLPQRAAQVFSDERVR